MRAFAALTELFSEPIKNAETSFRRYDLTFENGKPVFTLSARHDRALAEWHWPPQVLPGLVAQLRNVAQMRRPIR